MQPETVVWCKKKLFHKTQTVFLTGHLSFTDSKQAILSLLGNTNQISSANYRTYVVKEPSSVSELILLVADYCEDVDLPPGGGKEIHSMCVNLALGALQSNVTNSVQKLDEILDLSSQAEQLPGVKEMVRHPMEPTLEDGLFQVIISLNDQFRWSREEIADWLETLDVDLRFKVDTPDKVV